mmetsp:Transcript_3114/g.5485  ORF Transcript_3114/g.5485 Transcript_3114/m.5485 type:complete len:221 (-) Transcript_3114:30-692(-)
MADLQVSLAQTAAGERPPLLGAGQDRASLPEREISHSMYLLLQAEIVAMLRERSPEQAETKLRSVGFATGLRLVTRLTAVRFPITTERAVMKFICKDLWPYLFAKPASRLQVDKQGRYIIHDNAFRWLENFPVPAAETSSRERTGVAQGDAAMMAELQNLSTIHLALPCGILQGALYALGLERRVWGEASAPSATFIVAKAASTEEAAQAPQRPAEIRAE